MVSDIPAGDGKIANFFYSDRGKLVRTNAMLSVYDEPNFFLSQSSEMLHSLPSILPHREKKERLRARERK